MKPEVCTSCWKSKSLCLCPELSPRKSALRLLILQHPQEPDQDLGSGRLLNLSLQGSRLRVGLSWPNLTRAWEGKPSDPEETPGWAGRNPTLIPSKWGTLYLGSSAAALGSAQEPRIRAVNKKGLPLEEPQESEALAGLEGVILLDGTWSQAKALWWRNAWLLKTRRLVLIPGGKSAYGPLRKEPRAECVSTLESAARTLGALRGEWENCQALEKLFGQLLVKVRQRGRGAGGRAPTSS